MIFSMVADLDAIGSSTTHKCHNVGICGHSGHGHSGKDDGIFQEAIEFLKDIDDKW